MKKLFYPLFALAAMAMTTSCSDELESGIVQNSNEATVSFKVKLENAVGSRTAGDGTTATELHYAVYKAEKNTDGTWKQIIGDEITALRCEGTTTIKEDLTAEVKLTLVKGQTYNFLFWAQCKDGYKYYTINYETGIVNVNYNDIQDTEEKEDRANNEERDAFFKVRKNLTVNGPINETITLKRPFAQINVGTEVGSLADAQTAEVWIKQSTFTIRNASKVLDTYSGAASTKDTDVQEVVYSLNDIIEDLTDVNDGKGDLLNVDDKDYEHLAMNYILVGDDAADTNTDDEYGVGENKQLVNTTFTIWGTQSATGTEVEKINEFEIPNVPVQRNWRTNIIGDILNETVTFNIVIDPEFDNDHNYYTEKEVAYAFASGGEVTLDKDVEITKPLYAYVGATDAETVKVITEKNIVVNLNGKTLTYTGDDIMARLGEGATVTFNGPGKVVASHYIASANAGGKIYVNGDAKDTEFTGKTCTLFQANGGEIYVSGGKFSNTYDATDTNKSTYLFNHIDAKKNNGLIEITGGTFGF